MSYYCDEELEVNILFSGGGSWISLASQFLLKDFLDLNLSRGLDVLELEAEQRYQFRNHLSLNVGNRLAIVLEFVISCEDESEVGELGSGGVLGCDFKNEFSKWARAILNAQVGGVGKLNHWRVPSPSIVESSGYTEERMAKMRAIISPDPHDEKCFEFVNSLREVKEIFNAFVGICVAKVHGKEEDFDYIKDENRVKWLRGLPGRGIRFEKNGLPSELFFEMECPVDLAQKFVDSDRMGIPKPFLLSSWSWDYLNVTNFLTQFLVKLNREIQKIEPGFRTVSLEDVSFTAEEMEQRLREGYHKYWPDLF